jgi:hypothetical protein
VANFLFWNTNQKDVVAVTAEACLELDIDVLILAECAFMPAHLQQILNQSRTHNDLKTVIARLDRAIQ